jgi:1-deoxy-D-xylulose-5-phosphate synthase
MDTYGPQDNMPNILDSINSPADLKNIPSTQLNSLAREIRQEIIDTVQVTGGHLASSLGAVELTIALHRIFDSPRDKIIWDVGHQAYAHKLLTGRRESFGTLRQYGGLSGFPVREESPHDAFGTGHASTSISAALGIAAARDLNKQDFNVIAVIGDGSITGGMALEGLNNAAHLGSRLIIILNDNGMSISPTVGGMAKLMNRVRFDHRVHRATEEGKKFITSLPRGEDLWNVARRLKSGLKGLVLPTMLWEELGFAYIGPIDGHNITKLESTLAQARDYRRRPVLIHILTTKGKGYGPAEDDAVCFHGVSPKKSDAVTAPSYSRIFADTMQSIMRQDPGVCVITAAMPEGNCLSDVQKEFPQRVFDVGICEQHAVTFAAGLATQGMKPVVAIYSTFLQRGFDQIIHDVCLQKLPVAFALDRAGIVGDDGKTHQGIFDLSYLSLIPGMVVAAPADENELRHLLHTAIYCGRPMAVRYPRGNGSGVSLDIDFKKIQLGQGRFLFPGKDVAIIAIGATVAPAVSAARELGFLGIEVAVADARFIRPLDTNLITRLAQGSTRLITVEENVSSGGLGNAVSAFVLDSHLPVQLYRMSIPDEYVEHGPQGILRTRYGLDGPGITAGILSAYPELKARHTSRASV